MNENHYKRMVEIIDLFQSKKTTLRETINNLEGLIGSLEGISQELKNAFLSRWGVLEDIYSSAMYDNRSELAQEESDLINAALIEIKDAAQKRQ